MHPLRTNRMDVCLCGFFRGVYTHLLAQNACSRTNRSEVDLHVEPRKTVHDGYLIDTTDSYLWEGTWIDVCRRNFLVELYTLARLLNCQAGRLSWLYPCDSSGIFNEIYWARVLGNLMILWRSCLPWFHRNVTILFFVALPFTTFTFCAWFIGLVEAAWFVCGLCKSNICCPPHCPPEWFIQIKLIIIVLPCWGITKILFCGIIIIWLVCPSPFWIWRICCVWFDCGIWINFWLELFDTWN